MEEDGKKPNLTGLKLRAFVCDANTHVGQSICHTLNKKGDYEVWGTAEDDEEVECKWVKQLVKREDPKQPLSKCLLDSDLIVYQLKSGLDDATAALKLLMNSHYETEKTFILISSVLTWNDTKQNAELASKEENEDEAAPEDEEVEQETFTEDMYNKRVPHVKYTAWKEVEKLCKKANSKTLHTYVLFSGLPYGEGEDKLHALFKQAWHLAPEGIPVFGTGKQVVPLVHVRDLATFVWKLATRDDHEGARYCFACDEGNVTWNALVKALADTLGTGKTYRVPERDYVLYEHVEHFLVNLKVEAATMASLMADEEDWVARAGLVENVAKVVAEYLAHWKIQPLRLCVLGPPASGKTHLGRKLAEHYKLPHLTVGDVVREYEAQPVELQEQLHKIKQRRREEKRAARLEERRRLLAEQAAEREKDEDGEGEEELAKDPEEEPEEEEGEEEDEEDEVTEKIKERLNELQLVLSMRVHPKGVRVVEEEAQVKAKKPKPPVKGKLKKEASPGAPAAEEPKPAEAPPRYTDKCLAIMYRWKLGQPSCRNQGYILDGYPKTVLQAKYLFEEGELETPEEGATEEEEEPPAEEGEPKKAEDKLLPDKVICLTARDEFLTERMMQITHQAAHNTPADFQRRLDAFKAAAKSNGGVAAWLESVVTNAEEGREILVRAIAADAAPLLPPPPPASPLDEPPGDVVLAEAIEFVGVPHNYGPTPQEIEAAHLQELQKEQERQRLAAEAEAQRRAAENRDREEVAQLRREEAARLAAIQQQERAMLELRKEPLKKYLMETVIPILTQGLVDVCEVRPEDPIDYLAEWLFRHNPQLEAEMN